MEKLAIIMPVYNEEQAIGNVLDKWVKEIDKLGIVYTIHPYDDGSKDNSLQVIKAKENEYPGKIIAHTKPNSGHGPTILLGYREAAAQGYDWVFQIDSDDEMGPEGFYKLWEQRKNYDFLVGTRDGRKQALPRKVISAFSRMSVRVFYGKSIWDVNTPYRLMRVEAFKSIWDEIPENTFAPNVIISGMAAAQKLLCYETPIAQRDRQTGEVSIKKWKLLKAAMKSFMQTVVFSLKKKSLLLAFCVSTLFFSGIISNSPIVVFPGGGCDDSVFFTVGRLLRNNIIPYRDVFDHKGPVLYFINALGDIIGGRQGVGILEVVFWVSFLAIIYQIWKTLELNKLLLGGIFLILPLITYKDFAMGNLAEEYALPFIAYGNLYLIRLCLEKKILCLESIFLGVSAAMTLCLRPNMIAVFFVLAAAIPVYMLFLQKKYIAFIKTVFYGISGMLIVLLPIIYFFYQANALSDMWRCVYTFNIEYSNSNMPVHTIFFKMGYRICHNYQFYVPCLAMLYLFIVERKKNFLLNSLLLSNVALSILSCTFARSFYDHYTIILLPVSIIVVGVLCKQIDIHPSNVKYTILFAILFCWGMFIFGGNVLWRYTVGKATEKDWLDVAELIRKDNDAVYKTVVLGNSCSIYSRFNLLPQFKYIYQYPIANISKDIEDEFINSIRKQEYIYIIQPINPLDDFHLLQHNVDKLYQSQNIYEVMSSYYTPVLKNKKCIVYKRNYN